MGVEVVPEIELAVVPGGAEMEVENPLSEALLRIAEVEGHAPLRRRHAQKAHILHGLRRRFHRRAGLQLHQDVHNGLGPDPLHGGAADVADAPRPASRQGGPERRLHFPVRRSPLRPVGGEPDGEEGPQLLQGHLLQPFFHVRVLSSHNISLYHGPAPGARGPAPEIFRNSAPKIIAKAIALTKYLLYNTGIK